MPFVFPNPVGHGHDHAEQVTIWELQNSSTQVSITMSLRGPSGPWQSPPVLCHCEPVRFPGVAIPIVNGIPSPSRRSPCHLSQRERQGPFGPKTGMTNRGRANHFPFSAMARRCLLMGWTSRENSRARDSANRMTASSLPSFSSASTSAKGSSLFSAISTP